MGLEGRLPRQPAGNISWLSWLWGVTGHLDCELASHMPGCGADPSQACLCSGQSPSHLNWLCLLPAAQLATDLPLCMFWPCPKVSRRCMCMRSYSVTVFGTGEDLAYSQIGLLGRFCLPHSNCHYLLEAKGIE